MRFFKNKPHTLAIIGNGFDMNHGFSTDYKSFVKHTDDPVLNKFKSYCENEDISTWYLFEDSIRVLSERFFLNSMTEFCDFEDNRKEVRELSEVFEGIHKLLMDYLYKETTSKPVEKKPCIEKYLNKNTVALNFNYTGTAEAYTDRIIYVHGSLLEKDILLGYDFREEGCLELYEDIRWSKRICRESLAFRRYFLGKKKYDPNGRRYKALVSGLEKYHELENTGRGIDDELQDYIPKYVKVHKFLKKYRKKEEISGIDFKKVKTVAVLGHGIQADRIYLEGILKRCINLDKVVIYRYSGENDESFNEKASFFLPYCKDIETVNY